MLRDTSKNWIESNPIIPKDVATYETDKKQVKVGDGITRYNKLPYTVGYEDYEETDTLKADYPKQLKGQTGMTVLRQRLEQKVDAYIAEHGNYLACDRIITNFVGNTVDDFELYGASLYLKNAVYSTNASLGSTIESLKTCNITIKQGTTTLTTIAINFADEVRGMHYLWYDGSKNIMLDVHDVLSKNQIIRNVGALTLSDVAFVAGDIVFEDAARIVLKIPNVDLDANNHGWMVQGISARAATATTDGVGANATYDGMVIQLSATALTSYTGADLREKVIAYLDANVVKILWAKKTPTVEAITPITVETKTIIGDINTTTDDTTFNAVAAAKVVVTRNEIRDYLLNQNNIKYNGQLKRLNNTLVNSKGKPIQINGVGTHHLLQYEGIQNNDTIKTIKYWGANVLRLTAYLKDRVFASSGGLNAVGYINAPEQTRARMIELIDACIDLGMYVIVDWHIYSDELVGEYIDEAKEFFAYFATKYATNPALIYELANEPFRDTAANLATYVGEVAPSITASSPNAVMLCGKSIDTYANLWTAISALAAPPPNLFLSPHYYVVDATNAASELSSIVSTTNALPVFVVEWGNAASTGGGARNDTIATGLINFMRNRLFSWCCWKLTNQDMTSSLLAYGTEEDRELQGGGGWLEDDLSTNGQMMFSAWDD